MTHAPFIETPFTRQVRGETGRMTWEGILLLVIGILAVVFPVMATLAATFVVGWAFLIAGIATVYGSFSIRGTGPFFGALLLGLLSTAGGVFLLFRPGVGAVLLTMTAGILFMFQGASETFLAFEARPARGWRTMLFSAICSVVLAIVILSGWPGTSTFTLGILFGINFITSGIAYLTLAGHLRSELRT
jgi:uncharacterized membrane protein HdeD (DUF308 family)